MRLFMINVLATAMLLTAATQASAITVTQTGTGGAYNVSDTITLHYFLNNVGSGGLSNFAFSVGYTTTVVAPDLLNSFTQNWVLAGDVNENPAVPNSGFKGVKRLSKLPTAQNGDTEALFGWSNGLAASFSEVSNELVGTLIFHAIAPGVANIAPFQGAGTDWTQDQGTYANSGQVFANINGSVDYFGGSITVVPEPTTALLIGLGLVGLGVAGSRGRQER